MRHFFLYTSNRLEHLALILAKTTAEPLDPMRPETILVQSAGMQRWVSMQLAREHGICANARFPFPVAFAYDLARTLLPGLPPEYALSQERMLWRVATILPALAADPAFPSLGRYLDGADTLKLIQLSQKIAFHFDQYLIFRPQWARQWESGLPGGGTGENSAEAWQAALWRDVARGRENEHRAALLRRVMAALEQNPSALPPRLSVFGVSTLPPAYLDLLLALAEQIPVYMFLLSPSRQYWGDLPGRRERLQNYRQLARHGISPHEESGNPLAALGTPGRDFHEMLTASGVEEIPLYRAHSSPRTLLEHVQNDLLELSSAPGESLPDLDDESIRVHCCHGPMREMEVLRDLILDRLQRDETLTPRDILIMAPDMDLYAPFIQAVFGAPEDPAHFLPFSMADRRPSQTLLHARLLLNLIEFGHGRFEATAVLELLEAPAIRQTLDLDEDEAWRIETWVDRARIRWGADSDFQTETCGACHGQNTWEQGLARLFLGYMTGPSDPVRGIAPLAPVSGTDQELLGRLAGFLERLRQMRDMLSTPADAEDWQRRLLWMLENFFPLDQDSADALCALRQSITELARSMSADAPQLRVDSRTMLHLLRGRLDAAPAEGGFLSSGLTFCGLRPMRAIPFRIICLAGLSCTGFPRQDTRPGFDLMAAAPRPGDRSLRDDDRYLFLESLISARDALILTYPGLSPRDNSESPPSVLVSELLDYLDNRARVAGRLPSEALVTRHRLQGFHPDYFRPGPIFSYSIQNCRGAEALCGPPRERPFFPASLADPAPIRPELDLAELENFLSHPVRHLLRSLQVVPMPPDEAVPDEEPLAAPDGLEGFVLDQDLLNFVLTENPSQSAVCERLRAGQALPPGPAGQDASRKIYARIRAQAELVRMEQHGGEPVFRALDLNLATCRITGGFPVLPDGNGVRIVTFRVAGLKGPDMLRLWLRHLTALAAGFSAASVHVAADETFRPPVVNPEQAGIILQNLARLYQAGMNAPLPLFPRASLGYARRRFDKKNGNAAKALELARSIWTGGMHKYAERDDVFLRAAYRDDEPDWDAFMATADTVYGPLFGDLHAF